MVPFLEVSHLPSSSSFYSAVIQPLGLRYLSAGPSSTGSAGITFGSATSPPSPVFEIRQATASGEQPLKRSRIVLNAASPEVVTDFHACAAKAAPRQSIGGTGSSAFDGPQFPRHSSSPPNGQTWDQSGGGEARVQATDFDGNIMEVVYVPPPDYPSRYAGSTVRRTQSTHNEVSRILDWNYDVAASSPHSTTRLALARHPAHHPDDEPYTALRRTFTTSTSFPEPTPSPREGSTGLSAGAVVGTLLGVAAGAAAGAALTYNMVKKDRARAPHQEFDAPSFSRRATFPEPLPSRGRFVEVERSVEKIRYPDDYPGVADHRRPPPSYMARYSQAGPPSRQREVDEDYEERSYHSSRYRQPGAPSVRTRSEAPLGRRPLMLADAEHRSYSGSRYSNAPPSIRRSTTFDTAERESYVSARSQRTASTIRPAPQPATAQTQLTLRSRPSSRVTTTTIKVGGNPPMPTDQVPRTMSRSGSYMSARNVPLPPSGVGSSHADWDDDADSVAPSDSISCVGSRRSVRPYH